MSRTNGALFICVLVYCSVNVLLQWCVGVWLYCCVGVWLYWCVGVLTWWSVGVLGAFSGVWTIWPAPAPGVAAAGQGGDDSQHVQVWDRWGDNTAKYSTMVPFLDPDFSGFFCCRKFHASSGSRCGCWEASGRAALSSSTVPHSASGRRVEIPQLNPATPAR